MKPVILNKKDGGARSVVIPPCELFPWDIIECDGRHFVRAYSVMTDRYREATLYRADGKGLEQRMSVQLTSETDEPRSIFIPASKPAVDIIERDGRYYVSAYGAKSDTYREASLYSVDTLGVRNRRTVAAS